MGFLSAVFFAVGFALAWMSRVRRDKVLKYHLPNRQIRQIWFPIGLICINIGALFALINSIHLPNSPLSKLQTQQQMTITVSPNLPTITTLSPTMDLTIVAYPDMLTQAAYLETVMQVVQTDIAPTLTAYAIVEETRMYTILQTGTAQRLTQTAIFTEQVETLTATYSTAQPFQQTATEIVRQATATRAAYQTQVAR